MHLYIAEIVESEPLRMKVEETGPFANLKDGLDVVINESATVQFQKDVREGTNIFLEARLKSGHPPVSGLKSLGVTDGELHWIFPDPASLPDPTDWSDPIDLSQP